MADYLPEPIIEEILSRVPAKSLFKFRCVSKSWLTLISSSRFISIHHQRSVSNPSCNKIIFRTHKYIQSFSYNSSPFGNDSAFETLKFVGDRNLEIRGSCKGLVLVSNISYDPMYIWNPCTGACKKLPYLDITHASVVSCFGFGYDEQTDDFKVFICYSNHEIDFRRFVLYSLKKNSWSFVEAYQYLQTNQAGGVFLNGALHWIDHCRSKIMCFQLATETFEEVPLPEASSGQTFKGLGVLAGHLSCVVVGSHGDDSTIWAMNEYGVKESWTQLITNNESYVNVGKYLCNPLCLSQEGEIISSNDERRLLKFNPKSRTIFPKSITTNSYLIATVYVESLFSPNGLTEVYKEQVTFSSFFV